MRLLKLGMFICILLLCFLLFLAVFSQISVNSDKNVKLSNLVHQRSLKIGDSFDHLMWFVQVSDLHLSFFQDKSRGIDLLELCDFTFKHINPSVVLATGDITDARKQNAVGSMQFKEEWSMYEEILHKCSIVKKTPWLDIRGNHDNFDVPSVHSRKNLFGKYSVQGKKHSRSYFHKLIVGSETYAFIAVDACPEIGIKMMFNFGGILTKSEVERLKGFHSLLEDADYTIWFGHYPTSCIVSHEDEIKSIIGSDNKSIAYLCGHLHTLFGLAPNMYSLQKSGFYELELADWKKKRMYRIAAIDHGLFSFADVNLDDWPVILVTNPKHALYQSTREPLDSMLTSTHIRVLVFSPDKIRSVRIKVDSNSWGQASHISGPLFVIPWEPIRFSSGIHYIYVEVVDIYGHQKVDTHPFSLDDTKLSFDLLPRMLLMLKVNTVLQVLFGFAVAFYVLPFYYLRYMNKQVLGCNKNFDCLRKNSFIHRWLKRLWILSNIDSFFYPIFLYPLYISVGPWAIAELLENAYGIIFAWGIFVNGTLLIDPFTYVYGILQLVIFHGPIILFTAYSLDKRLSEYSILTSQNKLLLALKSSVAELPHLILFLSQLFLVYAFYLAYDIYGVFFSPFRIWPLILVAWSWYHSKTIPLHEVKTAAYAWVKKADC